MYLLDTNICIYAINGRFPNLSKHLFSISPEEITVSAITVSELEYGAAKSHWGIRTHQIMHTFLASFTTLPFTEEDAICFGQLRALLSSKGTPVGLLDLMIAAQGISRNLTVVTHNTREFIRIPGIQLEDWTE